MLALGFLSMSVGVFMDSGVYGKVATHSPEGVIGKKAWLSNNCMVCHQFYGMGGYLGPDLTNVVSRLGEETVAWVLRNGRGSMPDMDLTEEEISSLVVFFNEIGNTGVFPQQSWPPGWFPATEHSLTDK